MVLQSSGAISFSNIQREFGGTNPISMSEYYAGGTNVPAGTGNIPSNGAVSMSKFHGTQKVTLTYNPTYTNWYTTLSRYTSSFAIDQTGTDPFVQLQMNSSSINSSVTHVYQDFRLQDYETAEIEFDIYITSSSLADALFFYMGYNAAPTNTYFEGVSSVAYQLNIEVFQNNPTYARGFHLIKNGSSSAVASYSTTTHISSTWLPVKVVWNKSATNTFQIYFNGTNIINYSDTNFASFISGSGSYWGIGSRTGGLAGDMYIRRVRVGVIGTRWSVSSTDPIIAWVIGSFQYYAIPCNSAAEITTTWQYSTSVNGPWTDFGVPSGTFVTVSGGVIFNGTIFSGYFRSSAWSTGNTNYYQRVGRNSVVYTTTENTSKNNRLFSGY